MVDKLCNMLTNRIRAKMPEVDDERAEVINYGLQLVIGEIPKMIIIALIAYFTKVFKLTLLGLLFVLPYKAVSGGVHLKTHIGCILGTTVFYIGNAILSKNIVFIPLIRYILTFYIWIFSMQMIMLYAPADTESVPILRKKERKIKKILSYIFATITLMISVVINNQVLANLLMFGTLMQTLTITRFIYKITKNKYGYETYNDNTIEAN